MLITIYDRLGNLKTELSPNDSSTQVKEVQGDNVLTLSFTHYDHIGLEVDDYVDFEGERFWLTEKYRPKQNARKEWVYDLKLYGVESMLKRLLVIKTVDGEDDPVFTLTAPVREHVAMIVKCMNDGLGNITDWKVGQVEGTENIVIDYFGKYCDEALKEIAEKVGVEAWVEGQTVNICRCEHGEPLSMGYQSGLLSIDPGTADNVKFYTRLYPVGSSRNIDRLKYGFTRLQLPGGRKFVEINADKYGRVDHYEQDAFADIYPRRTGVVSEVRSEVRTGEDGNEFTIYYFKDSGLNFDPNDYEIGGLVKRVSFQEGSELAGLGDEENGTYYFEVNFNSSTQEFEIITKWPYGDEMQLSGDKLVPKAGDKYILWNISMPDEYYALAEAEFLEAVEQYNAEHNLDIAVYKGPTDHVWIEDNDVRLTIGQRIRLESEEYFPGTGYRDSRITKITRKVNLPSYMDIEISDALSRTSQEKMSDSIDDVRSYAKSIGESINLPEIIRTGDRTKPTDNNLLSARRSYRDLMRKDQDDRSVGKIASDKGFEVGDFLAGVSGAMIGKDAETGKTFAEVDYLYARVKAYFESLTIIEANTLAGKQYITPGGGIKCTKVEEVKNAQGAITAYRCYFLSEQDGERTYTKIIEGDQAICEQFNVEPGTTQKATNHYWWRLVTAVDNDAYEDQNTNNHYGYIEVSASDCETNSDIPKEGDVIDQLGNRNDATRQAAMVFSTVDSDAPSIKLFKGIGSGATNAEHYSLADKDIISYGYDSVKGNAYFKCYGDTYFGARDASSFIEFDQQAKEVKLHNVNISVGSKVGDKPLSSLIEEFDASKYLRDALPQSTSILNGLVLTSAVLLGYENKLGERVTMAGHSGIIPQSITDKGKAIASFWGGPMVDKFFDEDGKLRPSALASDYAASVMRMDGSAYFGGGAHVFNEDGSGFLANGNIRWDASGVPTIGSDVIIKISEDETLNTALSNLMTHRIGVDNLFVVVEDNDARTEHDLSWAAIKENKDKIFGIKAKYGLFSDSYISSKGMPSMAGGIAGVTALSALSDVGLTLPLEQGQALVYNGMKWVNQSVGIDASVLGDYAKKSDIPSLADYAKKSDIPSLDDYALRSELVTAAERTLWNQITGKADKAVKISAGTGLSGGGTLEADRTLSLATSGVTAGTYTKLTVDAYGRATAGAGLTASDIPSLSISKISGLQGALDAKLDASVFNELFEKVTENGVTSIKAKYSLWTDHSLAAKGQAQGSGGASAVGGLIQKVYGWGSLGGSFDNDTLTDTFNAYTVNKLYADKADKSSLANYVDLTSTQEISGLKTINNSLAFKLTNFPMDGAPRANIQPVSLRVWDSYNQLVAGSSNYGVVLEVMGRAAHWDNQLYFEAYGHNIWHRASSYNDSTWTYGWARIAMAGESYTKSESDNRFLPLTGGTLTGQLKIKNNIFNKTLVLEAASGAKNQGTGIHFTSATDTTQNVILRHEYFDAFVAGYGLAISHQDNLESGDSNMFLYNTGRYISKAPQGTKPIDVVSTTLCDKLNADLLDGLHSSAFARADQSYAVDLNTVNGIGMMCNPMNAQATSERHYPIAEAGCLIYCTAAYSSANQIYGTYSSNRWFARGGSSNSNTNLLKTAWREFAFKDDNVASATRLQGSFSLWGQTFYGNNVSGSLSSVSSIQMNSYLFMTGSDNAKGQYFVSDTDGNLTLNAHNAYSYVRNIAYFSYNGNVGFGTTTPAEKIDVNGNAYIRGNLRLKNSTNYGCKLNFGDGEYVYLHEHADDCLTIYSKNITLKTSGGTALFVANTPYVGVCTDSPSYPLDVNGNAHVSGETYFGGNIIPDAANTTKMVNLGWSSRGFQVGYFYYLRGCTNNMLKLGANNTDYVFISTAGKVGFGTSSPSHEVDVVGTIHSTVGIFSDGYVSSRGGNSSDIRLKTDIRDFRATDILMVLRPVAFRWNDMARRRFKVFDTDDIQYGLIAQHVKPVAPWLVDEDMFGDGLWGVHYRKLIPVMHQGIREQVVRIDDLEIRIRKLEKKNDRLERENEKLRGELEILKCR